MTITKIKPKVGEKLVIYSKECTITGDYIFVTVSHEEYERICKGKETIQEILPHKTNEERELIISGTTEAEWKHLSGEEEEVE